MKCMTRLFAIIQKEIRQLLRDRLTFAMIVGIPMMQIVLFGYAINTDVRHLRGAVADEAGTQLSRELVDAVQASQVLDMTRRARDAAELEQLLRLGEIDVGVYIPRDFERRLQQADRPAAQLLVDGSDPVLVGTARGLTGMTLRNASAAPAEPQGALFEVRNYYNPERRSAVFVVPGLIGVILTMTMVLFTAIALVRERERGNMEMLITTPLSPWELTIGKVLPFVGIGLIQVTVILLVGRLLFEVPIRGSLLELYGASLLFIVASLALGVFISTLAQTQFQAMQMAFFTFLPQILLSGFMFPFAGMPKAAQWIAELLPLTHFLRLARGIMLRSAGLLELWPEILALLVFAVLMLSAAVTRVTKRLD
jgi:ABC-2 type transport system permease protein